MKIVLLCTVGDSRDIVEYFVRHHAPMVDRMIFVDQGTGDGTIDVLHRLAEAELPIEVRPPRHTMPQYIQTNITTQLMRAVASEMDPDWILPLDIDEFLQVQSRSELESELGRVPDGHWATFKWATFVPIDTDWAKRWDPLYELARRRVPEGGGYIKAAVPRSLARKVIMSRGSHVAFLRDGSVAPMVDTSLLLGHIPVRSPAQAFVKDAGRATRTAGPRDAPPADGFGLSDFWRRRGPETVCRAEFLDYAMDRDTYGDDRPTSVDPHSRIVAPGMTLWYTRRFEVDVATRLARCLQDVSREMWRLRGEWSPSGRKQRDIGRGRIPFDLCQETYAAVALAPERGAVFVQVGCGDGWTTVHVAELIAHTGKRIDFTAFVDPTTTGATAQEIRARLDMLGAYCAVEEATSVEAAGCYEDGSVDFGLLEDGKDDRPWIAKLRVGSEGLVWQRASGNVGREGEDD